MQQQRQGHPCAPHVRAVHECRPRVAVCRLLQRHPNITQTGRRPVFSWRQRRLTHDMSRLLEPCQVEADQACVSVLRLPWPVSAVCVCQPFDHLSSGDVLHVCKLTHAYILNPSISAPTRCECIGAQSKESASPICLSAISLAPLRPTTGHRALPALP